jgi:septal ring factor EnvC (AmiA/AmiB activator)
MNDIQREITAQNVDKLVATIRSEREAREDLYKKIVAMERHVQMLTSRIQQAESNSHTALAMIRNMNGSSTGD